MANRGFLSAMLAAFLEVGVEDHQVAQSELPVTTKEREVSRQCDSEWKSMALPCHQDSNHIKFTCSSFLLEKHN